MKNFDKGNNIKQLTPLQYEVTQKEGTEPPFRNEFWNHHERGIYVDIVSGEPLFCSLDKFESGSGWPSFTRALEPGCIVTRTDRKMKDPRTEVRSKIGNSHLGHVFDDGPAPTGKRYCINSAALRFIPVERLEAEGYGDYENLFTDSDPNIRPETMLEEKKFETAILAGGCFWGVEDLIRKIPGVLETEVGYTGGDLDKPTYEDVKTGRTGHVEAVRIHFDPLHLKYESLLEHFFRLHDPTTRNQQGNDMGTQYRSVIFFLTKAQKGIAERMRTKAQKMWGKTVVTEILPAKPFYRAEKHHQKYLVKNPDSYTCHYYRDFPGDKK